MWIASMFVVGWLTQFASWFVLVMKMNVICDGREDICVAKAHNLWTRDGLGGFGSGLILQVDEDRDVVG